MKAQRTITFTIIGEEKLVDDIARRLVTNPFVMAMGTAAHWQIEQRKDWLDENGNVIPPETIVEALKNYFGN